MKTKTYSIVIGMPPDLARLARALGGDWKIIDSGTAKHVWCGGLTLDRAQKLFMLLYIEVMGDSYDREFYDNMFGEDGTSSFTHGKNSYWIEDDDDEDVYKTFYKMQDNA